VSIFSEAQEKIIDSTMRQAVKKQLKGYRKRGIQPTAERVMQDINDNALTTLASYGYTPEKIKVVVDDELRRSNEQNRMSI